VRRLSLVMMLAALVVSVLEIASAQAVTKGKRISDATCAISFYLPSTWKHPVVTTATSLTTKVLVQNVVNSTVQGVVQVQVLNGRHTNVADIADGLLAATSGAKVVGSRVVSFPFGSAEELDFTIQTTSELVYGTADAF
jgi:hypothetical protein